jgi:hypothetical protein
MPHTHSWLHCCSGRRTHPRSWWCQRDRTGSCTRRSHTTSQRGRPGRSCHSEWCWSGRPPGKGWGGWETMFKVCAYAQHLCFFPRRCLRLNCNSAAERMAFTQHTLPMLPHHHPNTTTRLPNSLHPALALQNNPSTSSAHAGPHPQCLYSRTRRRTAPAGPCTARRRRSGRRRPRSPSEETRGRRCCSGRSAGRRCGRPPVSAGGREGGAGGACEVGACWDVPSDACMHGRLKDMCRDSGCA